MTALLRRCLVAIFVLCVALLQSWAPTSTTPAITATASLTHVYDRPASHAATQVHSGLSTGQSYTYDWAPHVSAETRASSPVQAVGTVQARSRSTVAARGAPRSAAPTGFAAEDGITYGAHDIGPLPEGVANTFRGGSYTARTLQSDTTLYRVYGGQADPIGSYWSTTAPSGPLQAQLDGAINPAWGNTIERVATARVPAGTTIYEGAAGEQGLAGGGSLLGGGNQVYIPNVDPSWVTP